MSAPEEPRYCYRHPSRETLLRCSTCERPICPECMTSAPVGIRCPECAHGLKVRSMVGRRTGPSVAGVPLVTGVLIAVNVLVWLLEQSHGGSSGSWYQSGALYAPLVHDGEWTRVITGAFLHADFGHIALNMLSLWFVGSALEQLIGPLRFGAIYAISLLGGSAGAMLIESNVPVVGASGAIFGLFGALVYHLWRQGVPIMQSSIGMILVLNLAGTFILPNISIGGHLGGLASGALAAVVLSDYARGSLAHTRLKPPVLAGLAGLAVAVVVLNFIAAAAA
jgi:membrane associated rhomboid family serine protease